MPSRPSSSLCTSGSTPRTSRAARPRSRRPAPRRRDIRTGAAHRVRRAGGARWGPRVELSDGAMVEDHEDLPRSAGPLRSRRGLETIGVRLDDGKLHRGRPSPQSPTSVYVAGDSAGPRCTPISPSTRARRPPGSPSVSRTRPDHRAIPRRHLHRPAGGRGGAPARGGLEHGPRRLRETHRLSRPSPPATRRGGGPRDDRGRPPRARSCSAPSSPHRARPTRSATAVLAIKTRTPIEVLADTIHPFPTAVRVLGGLFGEGRAASAPACGGRDERARGIIERYWPALDGVESDQAREQCPSLRRRALDLGGRRAAPARGSS